MLENIKELKQKKENDDKRICISNQNIQRYNYNSSIREQLDETEKEERDIVNELAKNEKLFINLSPNGGFIKDIEFKESGDMIDLDENKQIKNDLNNLEYIKKMSSMKSPEPNTQIKGRDSQLSNNLMDLLPNSPYQMRPYVNSNIKRPVNKKSTNIAMRYNNLVSRKLTSKYDNSNDMIIYNNNNSNANGNTGEERNQGGGKINLIELTIYTI